MPKATKAQLLEHIAKLRHQNAGLKGALTRANKERSTASTQNKQRLRAFMDAATEAFLLWDSSLRLVDINPVGLRTFSPASTRSELVGKPVDEVIPQVRQTGRYEKYRGVLETGQPFYADDVVADPRLGHRHFLVRAFRVGGGMGLIYSDISQRVQAEAERAAHERFVERVVNAAPTLTYIYDLQEQKNVYSNDGIQRLLGFSAAEMQKMGAELFSQLLDPESLPAVVEHQKRLALARDGDVLELEYRMRNSAGEYRTLRSFESVFARGDDGAPKQTAGTAIDVTDLRAAQLAARRSEAHYLGVFEAARDGIIIADPAGVIVDANPAACEMHGYSRGELVGKHARCIVHPDNRPKLARFLEVVGQGGTFSIEARERRRDGSPFDIEDER